MKTERHDQIIEILKEKKCVSVRYLHNNLYTSLSTLRRDLIELEKSCRIKRKHGSVAIASSNMQPSFNFRESACCEMKNYICRLAKRFLENNQSIFIDASSTTYPICGFLEDYLNISVITNSLKIANRLSEMEKINSFLAGGKISTTATSVTGKSTVEFLEQFSVDIVFISSLGLDLSGANDADIEQSSIKKTMIKNARKTVLMVDSTKFDTQHFYRLASFEGIDHIVTDKQPSKEYLTIFEKNNCDIIWE